MPATTDKSGIDVSIIVLTLNEEKNIALCLSGIFSQHTNLRYEVLVIDSSSSDRTVEIASTFPVTIHRIQRNEFHHGGTRNLGARLSAGKYLVFLAGDAYPVSEHWLETLIQPMANDEMLAGIYGKQIPKPGCDPINAFRMSWNYNDEKLLKKKNLQNHLGHRLASFSTVNCSIRRTAWEAHHFREDIPIYEDYAFAQQTLDEGKSLLYEPLASVYHSHNLGTWDILYRYYFSGYILHRLNAADNLDGRFTSEGRRYFVHGVTTLFKEKKYLWVVKFICHTMAGYGGLLIGKQKARFEYV